MGSWLYSRHRPLNIALAIIVLWPILTYGACPGNRQTIRVGWESWPPYQYVDEDGILTGVDIEMASIIMSEMQCKLEFIELPWKRHLKELEAGTVDLAMGASLTKEREQYAHFTTPYRQELNSLFVKKSSKFNSVETLEEFFRNGGRVGLSLGYYYGDKLTRLIGAPPYKQQATFVRDNTQLYQMLERDRISGFVADVLTVAYQAETYHEILDFEPVVHANSSHIYMMLSKRSTTKEYIGHLNRALEQLKESGTLFDVTSRYLLPGHNKTLKPQKTH